MPLLKRSRAQASQRRHPYLSELGIPSIGERFNLQADWSQMLLLLDELEPHEEAWNFYQHGSMVNSARVWLHRPVRLDGHK